jgi:2C-methyl-D-erythritol 2,4-cyclodiphosphate synthase
MMVKEHDTILDTSINQLIENVVPEVIETVEIIQPTVEIIQPTVEIIQPTVDMIQPKKMNNSFIIPKQPDTLFWCIYIAVFGYADYYQIDRNYGVKELEIKKKIVDFIPANASKFKNTNYKITKVAIQEILSELMTSQKETSMLCLIAMIIYFNINVIMIDAKDQTMLEFICDKSELETNPTHVLIKDTFGKYKLQSDPITSEVKSKYIILEHHLKPLKPATAYKVDDLILLLKKLGAFDENKKYKKPELYKEITEMIQWK